MFMSMTIRFSFDDENQSNNQPQKETGEIKSNDDGPKWNSNSPTFKMVELTDIVGVSVRNAMSPDKIEASDAMGEDAWMASHSLMIGVNEKRNQDEIKKLESYDRVQVNKNSEGDSDLIVTFRLQDVSTATSDNF